MPHQQPYPIAPFSLGESRVYLAEDLDSASAWSLVPGAGDSLEEGATIPVVLLPHPATGGWTVRSAHGGIGRLGADVRARYPDLERVTRSGLASSTVGVLHPGEQGLLELEVWLPLPALAVPRNNLPAATVLLPQGVSYVVDTSAGEGLGALADAQPCQVLATLTALGDSVIAAYGETVLGVVQADDSLLAVLRDNPSLAIAARAFIVSDIVVIDAAPEQVHDSVAVPPLRVPAPEPIVAVELPENPDVMVVPELDEAPRGHRPLTGPPVDEEGAAAV